MTPKLKLRANVALALLAGLALRLYFVLKFPVTESGDAPFYIDLAWNWLRKGVYGFNVGGQLTAVDMRVPGYPAFLAAIFMFFGKSPRAVMVAQAVVDLAGCMLIALIAARLATRASRRRVTMAALWLAALCPFTANYCAVVLTETVVILLTSLALLVLLETELGGGGDSPSGSIFASNWFLGGIVVGFGALVRPETPLLLIAAGLLVVAKWWRPRDWRKVVRAGVLMGAGLILPLLPWAARNWYSLHDVQFLAPRHSELPGEYTPLGFNDWTDTWMWRVRDVYLTQWKVNVEEIPIEDVPGTAFDSDAERARVAELLEQYNETLTMGPELDSGFREVARERTARHPVRTHVKIPFLRALTLWFAPRVELLPYSGHMWPLEVEWEDDRKDFVATASLVIVNCIYVALAMLGAWITRRRPGWGLLLLFIVLRTWFFTTFVETPEPRYLLECFPAVIAFAAQAFAGRDQLSSTGSG